MESETRRRQTEEAEPGSSSSASSSSTSSTSPAPDPPHLYGGVSLQNASSFADIPSFVVTGGTCSLHHVWDMLRRLTARSPSTLVTLTFALVATIANHIRRTFYYGTPLAGFLALRTEFANDWRIVLARPDIYLETVLKEANWTKIGIMTVTKFVWDNATLFGAEICFPAIGQAPPAAADMWFRFAAAVLYMVWLLAAIENAVAQSSCCVAIVWSVVSLACNNSALLMRIVAKQKLSAALLAYPTFYLFDKGLVPTVVDAIRNSLRRKPGVLLVILGIVGGMRTLLVHRSRLYIAIEASAFFVFMTALGVSTTLLLAAQKSLTRQFR